MTAAVVTGNESRLRDAICALSRSMYERGLTHGSTGNVSVRVDDGWLMTPTGSSLGSLDPATLSKLDRDGRLVSGDPPTKEHVLHRAMYAARGGDSAVIHLHSTHSVAVSVLDGIDPADAMPPLTAYYVMRVGTLPLVPYHPPGDIALADAARVLATKHHALLLANHGPIVSGTSLSAAADAIEELEATARLYLLLGDRKARPLTTEQVDALKQRPR
jgi:ribulose-5-phosphate 4-epimerase/fuculose-1-phosphate aldolase